MTGDRECIHVVRPNMHGATIRQAIKKAIPAPLLDILYSLRYPKLPTAHVYADLLERKSGIEIGGPSDFFKYIVPIYPSIATLDGVNFSNQTMWEGSLKAGNNFNYYKKKKAGVQYIHDTTDLSSIESNTYDFLLSSNCLEHVANPLKALEEWVRVVSHNGYLLLVLPNKSRNFDHRRPTTSFEHILEDYKNNVSEDDLSHLDEILELHDLSMDPPAGSFQSFKKRSLDNFSNRGLHHHVFDQRLMRKMFDHFQIELIKSDTTDTDYISIGRIVK